MYSFRGSRFSLSVPANSTGSWRIMVIFERRSSKLNFEMSFPSRIIWPDQASSILSKHIMIVDFPDPVRPTTPIFYPPVKVTLRPLKTKSKLGRYLHLKSMNLICPLSGQVCPIWFPIALRYLDLILRTYLFLRYS